MASLLDLSQLEQMRNYLQSAPAPPQPAAAAQSPKDLFGPNLERLLAEGNVRSDQPMPGAGNIPLDLTQELKQSGGADTSPSARSSLIDRMGNALHVAEMLAYRGDREGSANWLKIAQEAHSGLQSMGPEAAPIPPGMVMAQSTTYGPHGASTTVHPVPQRSPEMAQSEQQLVARAGKGDPEAIRQLEALKGRKVDIAGEMAKVRTQAQEAMFTPEALKGMVDYTLATGQMFPMGFGPVGRAKYAEALSQRLATQGGMPNFAASQALVGSLRAELTKVQSLRGPVETFMRTSYSNLDIAEQLSDAMARSDIPALNRLLIPYQIYVQGAGDTAALQAAMRVAISETSRVLSSATTAGVVHQGERERWDSLLNATLNPEQVRSVIAVLKRDMQSRANSFAQQETSILASIRNAGPGSAGAASPHAETVTPPGTNPQGAAPLDMARRHPLAGQTVDLPDGTYPLERGPHAGTRIIVRGKRVQ